MAWLRNKISSRSDSSGGIHHTTWRAAAINAGSSNVCGWGVIGYTREDGGFGFEGSNLGDIDF